MSILHRSRLSRHWRRYAAAYSGVAAVIGVAAMASLSIHFSSTSVGPPSALRPGVRAPAAPPPLAPASVPQPGAILSTNWMLEI